MEAQASFSANAKILPVEFVIMANNQTTLENTANGVRIVEVDNMKIIYWEGCTTYFEMNHPSNGKYLNIFIPNEAVDYELLKNDPTMQKPDMSCSQVKEALA